MTSSSSFTINFFYFSLCLLVVIFFFFSARTHHSSVWRNPKHSRTCKIMFFLSSKQQHTIGKCRGQTVAVKVPVRQNLTPKQLEEFRHEVAIMKRVMPLSFFFLFWFLYLMMICFYFLKKTLLNFFIEYGFFWKRKTDFPSECRAFS